MKEALVARVLNRELEDLRDYLRIELAIARDTKPHCSQCRDWFTDSAQARADFIDDLLDRFPILKEAE